MEIFSYAALFGFAQVLVINIVLSGDNAVVIGMVASRVAAKDRHRVIFYGMAMAVVLRLVLAVVAVDLLNIVGLTLAGGIILLWVAWRLFRDIRESKAEKKGADTIVADYEVTGHPPRAPAASKAVPFGRAIFQIVLADVSMSVDNVLAVAGAADRNVPVLIVGLVLSIALMGVAAAYIAKLLQRFPALAYVGVVLIVYVALMMIWDGGGDMGEYFKLT